MKKIAFYIAVVAGLVPSVIFSFYAHFAIFSISVQTSLEDLQQEVDFSTRELQSFAEERYANAREWASSSQVKVGIEFRRPEGVVEYLDSLLDKYASLEWIALVDLESNIVASSKKMGALPDLKLDPASESSFSIYDGKSLFFAHGFVTDSRHYWLILKVKTEVASLFTDRAVLRMGKYGLDSLSFHPGGKNSFARQNRSVFCPSFSYKREDLFLCASVSPDELNSAANRFNIYMLAFAILLSISTFFAIYFLLGFFVNPIRRLFEVLNERKPDDFKPVKIASRIPELENVEKQVNALLTRLEIYALEITKKAKTDALNEVAKKLAHDIKSPISALNVILEKRPANQDQMFEILESVVSRINDISQGLRQQLGVDAGGFHKTWVNAAIEEIVREKILEYSSESTISIRFMNDDTSIFCDISESDLKRVLSNLINNSYESMANRGGYIEVALACEGEKKFKITVKDNGVGIRKDILEKLNRGEPITHKKDNHPTAGSGIGVKTASETIEKANGSIFLESVEEIGTRIVIILPRSRPS